MRYKLEVVRVGIHRHVTVRVGAAGQAAFSGRLVMSEEEAREFIFTLRAGAKEMAHVTVVVEGEEL